MGLRIIDTTTTGPNGWRYRQPESGYEMHSIVWVELLRRIRAHRESNGFPLPPGWEIQAEHDVCEQANYDGRICRFEEEKLGDPVTVGLSTVLSFLKVMGHWMVSKEKWVSQEEAERRGAICARCPANVNVDGCASCRNMVGVVAEFLGNRVTASDGMLKACGVCGCSNIAQVHLPLDVLAKGITPEMEFPSHCWKQKSPAND